MRLCLSLLVVALCPVLRAQTDTITVGALQRTYTLRLPSAYDGTTPLPLVIAMHGGFGSGTQLESQSALSDKAEQEGFIVVYPDGVAGTLNIRTWNAGGCCGYSMNNNIDDVGFISAMIDTLVAQHAIDTLRIYATGMSNGGFMSYRLACELSERIAAIAPVSASMTIAACQPTRPVPVIGLHSYQDESVPWQGGIGNGVSSHYNSPQDSVQTAFALHANCVVLNDTLQHDAVMTVVRWHDCDCGAEVLLYMTQDGGHSWPGGTQTPIGDPPSQAISANDLMWDFFEQHSLDCLTTGVRPVASSEAFTITPSESPGVIRITGEGITSVRVLDARGRTVYTRSVAPVGSLGCNLSALGSGVFVVSVTDAQGRYAAQRIVLTR